MPRHREKVRTLKLQDVKKVQQLYKEAYKEQDISKMKKKEKLIDSTLFRINKNEIEQSKIYEIIIKSLLKNNYNICDEFQKIGYKMV